MPMQMIVTDLDRTLLRPDKSISDYSASVFRSCQQRGITIVFATARAENSCKRFMDMLNPDAIISNGGALARIDEKTVYRATLTVEIVNRLLLSLLKTPNTGYITVHTDHGQFVNQPVDESDLEWVEYLPAYPMDFSRGLDCEAYRIAAEISDDTTAYQIASHFNSVRVVPFSGENWFCFAHRNANKWNGVKKLAAYTGADTKNIVAFGDDYHDLEMLKHCGIGVAVANAIDQCKTAADHICGANDCDGVAKWLAKNVL